MRRSGQAAWLRRVAYLLQARVPLDHAIEVAGEEGRHVSREVVIRSLREGQPLSEALEEEARMDAVTLALLRAGEVAGDLPGALRRAASRQERQVRMRRRLLTAALYPSIVLVLAIGLSAVLLGFVLPELTHMMSEMTGAGELPALTNGLLGLGEIVRAGARPVLLMILGGLFLAVLLRRDRRVRAGLAWLRAHLPGTRQLVRLAREQAIADAVGALLSAGVRLTEALDIAAEALGSEWARERLRQVREEVASGLGLGASLRESGLVGSGTAAVLEAAEAAESLPEALREVALDAEERLEARVAVLLAGLEPALIVGVGGLVLVVVVAVFLPLTTLLERLSG